MSNEKLTKTQFEQHLFELNDDQTLEYRKHNSYNHEDGTNTIVHLYYNDNGHIGSWQRGGSYVVFEERLPTKSWTV